MSEPFVDFRHVYLAYDGAAEFAVEDIDLQTRAGEFIAIVGPSGCGKSTFMKLATGLKQPNRGSVVINGQTVTGPLKFVGMAFLFTGIGLALATIVQVLRWQSSRLWEALR